MTYKAYNVTIRGLFRNTFEIREGDQHVYTIRAVDAFKRNYEMTDAYGNVVYTVIKPFSWFKLHFHILKGQELLAHVECKQIWKNKLNFSGVLSGHTVEGSIGGSEYKILNGSQEEVGIIKRKYFSVKNQYQIAVEVNENLELYLLVPVLINSVVNSGS